MIHISIPYRIDKNLGKAYNIACKGIAEEDWIVLMDYDVMFLLPETIAHLYKYIELFPDTDLFTAYANRNHISLHQQLLGGVISENPDIKYHQELAVKQKQYLYNVTEIKGNISGFFMLLSKRLWNEIHFPEHFKCFGVDFYYSKMLHDKKKKILRMEGIYLWHSYRLLNGMQNKNHLL